MQEARKPNAAIIAVIIVALLAAAAGGTVYLMNRQETNDSGTTTPAPSSQPASTPSAHADSYKDGTYTATGRYLSPGGQESVDVEITLKNDSIESAAVTPHPASTTSTQYQGEFVNNFKSQVIGKDIDEVKLSRVAGSSLTSGGFNEAIEKIKDEAAI